MIIFFDLFFILEHQQMMNFLLNKIQLYIECPNEILTLKTFVSGDQDDLKLIEGENQPIVNQRPLMALIGQPGAGKTMTLAKFALEIEVKNNVFKFNRKN